MVVGREGMTKKGHHKGVGNDNKNDNYAPSSTVLASAATFYDLESMIPLGFEGQEAVVTAVRYTELAFFVFDRGYLLIILFLVHWGQF